MMEKSNIKARRNTTTTQKKSQKWKMPYTTVGKLCWTWGMMKCLEILEKPKMKLYTNFNGSFGFL